LKAAKARGVQLGRKPALTPAQVKHARKLIDGGEDPRAVARTLGVNRSTLYRNFAKVAREGPNLTPVHGRQWRAYRN
jgi:DNA invertase Pin-like site-specific DNA recombinase